MGISEDIHEAISAEKRESALLYAQPKMEDTGKLTFADFVTLADRWAALDFRHRAAAMMAARGSVDGAESLIGLQYQSPEAFAQNESSPAWDLVGELLFDIHEHGFHVPSNPWGEA
jgi:hypothetical protein